MTKLPQVNTQANAVERSTIYKLLSLAFRYPTEDIIQAFQNGEYMGELLAAVSAVPHLQSLAAKWDQSAERSRQQLDEASTAELEANFVRTFDVGASKPPCPPYEGFYRKKKSRTTVMLEVSEFYKHFGLAMDQDDGKRELPDHLCAELEFLHFLTFKEAQAREEENQELLDGYLLAQKDFLERHLSQWLPDFAEKLQSSAYEPFYAELAGLAKDATQLDHEWVTSTLQ